MSNLSFYNAHRWVNCPGSVRLIDENPSVAELDGKARQQGRDADKMIGDIVAGRNIVNPDPELHEAVSIYLIAIRDVAPLDKVIFEGNVNAPNIHFVNKGRPDAYYFDKANDTIYIWDFKFGHRYVDVYKNWQLINAAAGLLVNTNNSGNPKFVLTIVQPRCYCQDGMVRSWEINADKLRPYFNQLISSAKASESIGSACETGEQCLYCPAAHVCSTLRNATMNAADLSELHRVEKLPDDVIGFELHMLQDAKERLEARIGGLVDDVTYRLKKGDRVAGYHLEQSVGRESWTVAEDRLFVMGDMLGVNLRNIKAKTPKQALQVGFPETIIKSNVERKKGAIEAVPDKIKFSEIFNK